MSTKISPRTVGLFAADIAIIFLAIVLALYLRLGWTGAEFQILQNNALTKALLAASICLVTMYLYDLYDYSVMHHRREMLLRLIQATGISWTILAITYYLIPPLMIGRGTLIYSVVFTLVLLLIWRLLIHYLTGHPELGERVLILGAGKAAADTANVVSKRRDAGYRIAGFVSVPGMENGDAPRSKKELGEVMILGTSNELEQIVHEKKIDRIVVALAQRRGNFPTDSLLRMSLESSVDIEECASFYERVTGQVHLEMLRPSWLIFSGKERNTRLLLSFRRVINRVLALTGLVLSLPVVLVTAIIVKLESEGPVFYRQKRVGKNGNTFELLKFRSMKHDAEADGKPVWATSDDARVTRFGKFIRKVRIDEIPQFWNILKGEMSFIGPRPERPHFVSELAEQIPFYEHRHLLAPGLTGWAQIKYPYGASVEDARQKLQYDLYYIKNQSLALDAIIIFETVKTVIFGRGGR
ncbi:MAG TPA: TIGR03013 family PEP-CTERM/XrtA system glycosyltransferase [Pyrinomonadaceae bacterium]|nr:TIGR03013 family PEP-CTERM/XrtA system glycosyltransferase [Pyrinomonadaceae bacterium]